MRPANWLVTRPMTAGAAASRPVKLAAQRLARAGQIEILRKGKPIDPSTLHGVLRLRLTAGE